jgi:hypothetical protein
MNSVVLELFIKCSSRDVCREGKICEVALDETYRDCYFVDLRRSELLVLLVYNRYDIEIVFIIP